MDYLAGNVQLVIAIFDLYIFIFYFYNSTINILNNFK